MLLYCSERAWRQGPSVQSARGSSPCAQGGSRLTKAAGYGVYGDWDPSHGTYVFLNKIQVHCTVASNTQTQSKLLKGHTHGTPSL